MMKKGLAMLLALAMLLCAGSAMAETVEYVNRVWENNAVTKTNETAENCTAVTASDTAWGTAGSKSWYVVSSDVTNTGRITVNGDVHLILMDGKTLTASQGVAVTAGNSLTIYGQTNDSGTMTATGSGGNAGIGGNAGGETGTITILGGTINATSHTAVTGAGLIYSGAGIGGGDGSNGGTITIRGGTITAKGVDYAKSDGWFIIKYGGGAGIGGGKLDFSDVNAAQGTVTIEGGTIKAYGSSNGAGIGGGLYGDVKVIIKNGTIEMAQGGSEGAGIGSGYIGKSTVTIEGGTVTAHGALNGTGVGSAGSNSKSTVKISGGTVNATGGSYASGIGSGEDGCYADVTIEGGMVNAKGGGGGAGIGSGERSSADVTITGGTIEMAQGGGSGAGIGSGQYGDARVIIQGGTILEATASGNSGAAIGRGYNGSATVIILGGSVNVDLAKVDSPRDGMGVEVFLHTLTLDGAADGTPVESAEGTVDYGVKDVRTIGDKLFFWLTDGNEISRLLADGVKYRNDGSGRFIEVLPEEGQQNGGMPQDAQNLPQTGDPGMLSAWVCLLAASGAMGMKMRRKK